MSHLPGHASSREHSPVCCHSSDAFASSSLPEHTNLKPQHPADIHASDIHRAVSQLRGGKTVVGYRNLLAYVSALGVDIVPASRINPDRWTFRGAGAYSATYEAPWTGEAPRTVIVKRPKESFTRDNITFENELQHKGLSSTVQEIRILAHPKLKDHPNLPHILGVFFQEEQSPPGTRPCVVFEKAVSTLSSYIREHGASPGIPPEALVSIAADVTSGVLALHAYGLVHGDLKPDNILLFLRDDRLVATVADLGTCGTVDSQKRHAVIPGTPGYYAPEYYEDSEYHSFANQPPRDVYGLGLLFFSMLSRSDSSPFPRRSGALQQDDSRCLEFLEANIPPSERIPVVLWETTKLCLRSAPDARPPARDVLSLLDGASTNASISEQVQDYSGLRLLTNPDDPRVNVLGNMDLSKHLFSKLLSEYVAAASLGVDIRLAVTMAAMYSGIVGAPPLDSPLCHVAKAQWLLKAVELGSLATVAHLFDDENTLELIEDLGCPLLEYRHGAFTSPSTDITTLIAQLQGFSARHDTNSLNLLAFLEGDTPSSWEFQGLTSQATKANATRKRLLLAFPDLDVDVELNNYLQLDVQALGFDNFDIFFGRREGPVRSAYDNDLEGLTTHPRQEVHLVVQQLLLAAIVGGSIEVVKYLVDEHGADPNYVFPGAVQSDDGSWEDASSHSDADDAQTEAEGETADDEEMEDGELQPESEPDLNFSEKMALRLSPLEDSILSGRWSVVEALLARGGIVSAASGSRWSTFHLLSRFNDGERTGLICEAAKASGSLLPALDSVTTEGPIKGIRAIEACMSGRKWANVLAMLEYGADPNAGNETFNLMYSAVQPLRPAPAFVLDALLRSGADPDLAAFPGQPPLYWAVGTTNVAATRLLLLAGAGVRTSAGPDLVEFARERAESLSQASDDLDVVDTEGNSRVGGLAAAREAAAAVYAMVLAASRKDAAAAWEQEVRNAAARCREDLWQRIWLAEPVEDSTFLLEIAFGDSSTG